MRTRRRGLRPVWDRPAHRRLLSGFTPDQMAHAYGLDEISFTTTTGATIKGNGSGQTIALIEAYHNPTLITDLQTFDRTYNLPDPALTVVNLGGPSSNAGWALEEALDV